jgi:hypothetical protein
MLQGTLITNYHVWNTKANFPLAGYMPFSNTNAHIRHSETSTSFAYHCLLSVSAAQTKLQPQLTRINYEKFHAPVPLLTECGRVHCGWYHRLYTLKCRAQIIPTYLLICKHPCALYVYVWYFIQTFSTRILILKCQIKGI